VGLMGIRRRDRTLNEPKPLIAPQPNDVNDDHYKGLSPDDIDYPLVESISDEKRSLELRAFTKRGLEQLKRIATEQFLPALDALGLNCAVLCEKRRDSGRGGRITFGVCFSGGRAAQKSGRQAIMLRQPDADSPRVAAVLLHEMAHLLEIGHAENFRTTHGQFLSWSLGEETPFTKWRKELLGLAKGDAYRPIAPSGSWDDYATDETPTPAADGPALTAKAPSTRREKVA
jgi:hypothetical protein